jgi:hypothetical protein
MAAGRVRVSGCGISCTAFTSRTGTKSCLGEVQVVVGPGVGHMSCAISALLEKEVGCKPV